MNFRILDRAVLALGDPYALRSACENVIRNAIRFTPSYAPVEITLSIGVKGHAQRAVISVCDGGPGVPEASLKAIFESFFRVTPDSMAAQSNGLGLAIAIGAVQLH